MPFILRVALPVPLPGLFDYLPSSETQVEVGSRVLVPWGRKQLVGVMIDQVTHSQIDPGRLKPVLAILDETPLLDAELMGSLAWAADYWQGAPGEAYANALPLALREPRPLPALQEENQDPATILYEPIDLNEEQAAAVTAVQESLGRFQTFLLDGVTGSGKTEVYLALIHAALKTGRQCLLLVPEIGLTPQTVRRLRERLGVPIEVLHSNLAELPRARSWLRARSGEAKVILGTRSAIFTPLPHAGLIIVDEEHDSSYKQQEGFRYHARDLAIVRARALGVPVLLGSATPSLESLSNVRTGRYHILHLRTRPAAIRPPQIRIVDMRAQRLAHGLSPTLFEAIGETLRRGEQALVFRNRRGYAPVLLCHACGWHAECPRCARPMTLHAAPRQLICHHCEHTHAVPPHCPACGTRELKARGQGTERLEEALLARFPDVPVLRIDRETTRRRNAFEQLLGRLNNAQPAILVGTQMLAKGHDLPNLTLVAIAGIDEGLYSVDFRAGEKLAQLLVQVAGRAGRAAKPGQVLLQTHHPDHPLLHALLAHGYGAAVEGLLQERQQAQLPPYSHQALLRGEAHRLEDLAQFLREAHAQLPNETALTIAGPMPAPMPLRAGRHRGQLLLESSSRRQLHEVLRPWGRQLRQLPAARKVRWSVDVDPVDLY